MASFNNKFFSNRQNWETPANLFNPINERYNLWFDLAANMENTKCANFFSDCALDKTWVGRCWLNPPYGEGGGNKLSEWVIKAYNESKKKDCMVVMLIPARTNTNWWHNYCMKADEIIFIKGRPKFSDAKHGLPQPLAVVVFDKLQTETVYKSLCLKTGTIE